jgi:hypothetical protein
VAVDAEADPHSARARLEVDVRGASGHRAFEHLVDPANDGSAAGEIAQALKVGVSTADFGGQRFGGLPGGSRRGDQPGVDLAAGAYGRADAQAGLEGDGREGLCVERIGHDEHDRTIFHAERSDPLGSEIVGLQKGRERRFGWKISAGDEWKLAGDRQGLGKMLFVNKAQLEEELIHPLLGMLRHRHGAGMLFLREQPVGDQPADRIRDLLFRAFSGCHAGPCLRADAFIGTSRGVSQQVRGQTSLL